MKTMLSVCFIIFVIGSQFCLQVPSSNASSKSPNSSYRSHDLFTVHESIRPCVEFWRDIYTKYSVHTAVLHDRKYLDIVYEAVDVAKILKTKKYSRRQKNKVIGKYKDKYRKILNVLHKTRGNTAGLDGETKRVARLFTHLSGENKFLEARNSIRSQTGLKERFLQGLHRQEKYIDRMRAIFRKENVPEEILVLPHVESSFNPHARSKVGATGLWQFTRSTGRRYLKINRSVDQRRDPYLSTKAAAKFLKYNYSKLNSWPLAIMAYNHGTNGILRAKRRLHTSKPEEIINRYSSRTFQFASRNFYPEFLASLEIVSSPLSYFPREELPPALQKGSEKISPLIAIDTQPVKSTRGHSIVLPAQTKEINTWIKSEKQQKTNKTHRPVNSAGNKHDSEKSKPGILSSFDKLVTVVPEVQAMDAINEPQLAVKPDASGNQFWIQAYHGESIWHYKEWSGVPIKTIRKINRISRRGKVKLGSSINIPKPASYAPIFEQKRRTFHKSIEDEYFSKYTVAHTIRHTVRRGENLWFLCNSEYNIPIWLFQKYNRIKPLQKLKIGDVIIIPVVTRI